MDCRRCGAPLNQGAVLCPECGARQRRHAGAVRCARCLKSVPLGLTVCPHCGRNVRPAGPRWGWWAVGLAVAILASLWMLDKLPIAQAVSEVQALRDRVSGWVQVLGPVNVPSATPATAGEAAMPTPTLVQVVALVTETPAATRPLPTDTIPATAEQLGTPTPAGDVVTPTVPMPAATATAAPTATLAATPTPLPTATPRPPTATLRPPTATPTATRSTASGATTYRVRAGDTLSSIAALFGITWQQLAAANGLTGGSTLSIGQELIIPASGATVAPTATAAPRATATPVPPSPTPQPQLAAPVLLSPGNEASYSGENTEIILMWQPVDGMAVDSQYQVIVTWVEQGVAREHSWFWKTTGSQVPPWLWGKADQPARKYTWRVRAVQVTTDGQGGELAIPLSPDSQSLVFYWN